MSDKPDTADPSQHVPHDQLTEDYGGGHIKARHGRINGWLLIAHSNKLQNYKPMRTGFLKTLKDAWFEG